MDKLNGKGGTSRTSSTSPQRSQTLKKRGSKFELQGQGKAQYRPEFKYDQEKQGNEKIWELMSSYLGTDRTSIQRNIANHVEYTLARTRFDFGDFTAYQAAAFAIRDRLIEAWNDTQQYHMTQDCKKVYYFSLEFLMGRTMQNALVNSDLDAPFKDALMDMGFNIEDLYE